jgi:hypothetical protein
MAIQRADAALMGVALPIISWQKALVLSFSRLFEALLTAQILMYSCGTQASADEAPRVKLDAIEGLAPKRQGGLCVR